MLVKNLSKILFCWLCSFWIFSALAEEDLDQKITTEPQQMTTEESDQTLEEDLSLTLALSGEPYTGPECWWFSDCEKICREIYNRRSVTDDCLDLHPDQVKELNKIYKTLDNPFVPDLKKIASRHFEAFVEIDYRPLKKLIKKMKYERKAKPAEQSFDMDS